MEITIENVTLEEIRKQDGAQKYTFPYVDGMPEWLKPLGNATHTQIWLCGWNRASNVKEGMTGKLEYRFTPSSGLYYFIRDKH